MPRDITRYTAGAHLSKSSRASSVFPGIASFNTVLLVLLLISTTTVHAETYHAQVDYGFGPLHIAVDADDKKIERCSELKIEVGGGFGPYKLGGWQSESNGFVPLLHVHRKLTESLLCPCAITPATVSLANNGTSIPLSGSRNTSATWLAAVAEGSHVSFNLT